MKYIQRKPTQLIRGGCKLNTQNIVGDIIKSRSKQLVHRHSVIKDVESRNSIDDVMKKIFFDFYKNKINVCMTSWVKRIHLVPNVIKNMLKQTIKPKMIWLTLSSDEFVDKTIIPQELFDLEKENENFTIHWVKENTKTMKKVFPVLPFIDDDDLIFLVDDDIIFNNNVIEMVFNHFCDNGAEKVISSFGESYGGVGFGGIGSTSAMSILPKDALNGYDIFINDEVLRTYEDDGVYTMLAFLNGYKTLRPKELIFNYEFIKQDTKFYGYNSNKTNEVLKNRFFEIFNYDFYDFIHSKTPLFVNWETLKVELYTFKYDLERNQNFKGDECIIIVPIYKYFDIKDDEKISLKRLVNIMGMDYEICFVCPKEMDVENLYCSLTPNFNFSILRVDKKWFKNIKTYSNLLVIPEFYECFKQYKYILIHQLDAFIIRNDLKKFIDMGYEYYGAYSCVSEGKIIQNGGLSLRKVESCINLCKIQNVYNNIENKSSEDFFFSKNLKTLNKDLINDFSVEIDELFNVNKPPFAVHHFGDGGREQAKCITKFCLNTFFDEYKLVANITTYPKRDMVLYETLKYFQKQTKLPDEIVLWLSEDEYDKNNLPLTILKCFNDKLITRIEWVEKNIYCHKRWQFINKTNDEFNIIFDDDLYYDIDFVENVFKKSISNNEIVCYHNVKYELNEKGFVVGVGTHDLMQCGMLCVPPKKIPNEIFNLISERDIFSKKCDESWITPFLIKYDIKVLNIKSHINYNFIDGSQDVTLVNEMSVNNERAIAMSKVFKLLKIENKVKRIFPRFDIDYFSELTTNNSPMKYSDYLKCC